MDTPIQKPNTLYDFYASKGETLPSVSERAPLYEKYGLGKTAEYQGTAEQNTALLSKLQGETPPTNPLLLKSNDNGITTSDTITNAENQQKIDQAKKDQDAREELARLQVQKQLSDLKTSLTPTGGAPTTPDLTKKYEDLRKEQGVAGLEEQLNSIRNEENAIKANSRGFKLNEPTGNSQNFSNARISEEERNSLTRLDYLGVQKANLIDQINSRNTYIGTVMELTGKDYENAKKQYDDEFTKNYQTQTLFNSTAKEDKNAASAYLSSISSMIQNTGIDWSKISPEMKATITAQELKAGWAPGTLETFSKIKPKANLLGSVDGVDENGQNTLTLIYSDENGMPGIVKTIRTGTAPSSAGGGANALAEQTVDSTSQSILAQTGLTYEAFLVLTGQMSQLSRDQATRNRALKEAQSWANSHGVDVSTIGSQYKTYNEVLSSNIERVNKTKIMEQELQGTIQNLQTVVKDKDLGKLRWGNMVKIWAGQEVNDNLAQQYAMHLNQLRNELAAYNAATQGRSGSSILQNDYAEAERTIKDGISKGSLTGLQTAVENSTGKMDTVMQNSVKTAQKEIWKLFGVGDKFDAAKSGVKEGDIHIYNGVTYKLTNGNWVPQSK